MRRSDPASRHSRGLAFLARTGDAWLWFCGAGLAWLFGGPAWRAGAEKLLLGLVLTAAAVFALKAAFRRRRPDGDWGGSYRKLDPYSFPSGHSARGAAVAVVFASLIGWPAGLVLFAWTAAMSAARVALRVHHPSDALWGVLVGLGAGFLSLWIG